MCIKGLNKDQLPDPLGIFQGIELLNADSFSNLVKRLSLELKIKIADDFKQEQMFENLKPEPTKRTNEIGIILTHQQNDWKQHEQTLFNLYRKKPLEVTGDWKIKPLENKNAFLSEELNKLSGLIFASPWKAKLEPEIIAATVEWVKKGGRLLLLGFELGDRHHEANLAELSQHFGISPAIDIVGPPDFKENKPYNTIIEFDPSAAENHPFHTNLNHIQLTNVQTLRVEPGGIEWLRVGQNVVYQPKREAVFYHKGVMSVPGSNGFYINQNAGWLPVAVEAPKGLCGLGSVQMIGTWDLLGWNKTFGGDNNVLVTRILDWLAGEM
jgi:hypothetical protein